MTKETALRVFESLSELYPEAKAELHFSNPFETLIATMLSAQCTDKRVNMVTEGLFRDYPDAKSMLTLTQPELEEKIRECGLFRMKAKHILEACRILEDKYSGQVPDNRKDLMSLPGVGQKTAGVVLLAAFGDDQIPVDTHVFRVSNRIGLAKANTPDKVEIQLREITPAGERSRTHHLLIWHGRRICHARNPACAECPLANGLCEKNL